MSVTLRPEPDVAAPPGPADAGTFPTGRRSDLLWQLALFVLLAGTAAVLDRPPGERRDRTVAALLVLALASSGMGIPVLVGVAVELLLTPEGRRRLWVVGVPFGLYLVWYLFYGVTRAGTDELAL